MEALRYFLIVLISFLALNTSGEDPPSQYQVKYRTTDTKIQPYLKYIDPEHVQDAESTFFVRISTTQYTVSAIPMNFFKAYQMCRRKGGYLIDSLPKLQEVNSKLGRADWPTTIKFWSAASSVSSSSGVFRWFSTGEDLKSNEFQWAEGEPSSTNSSCVVLERVETVFLMRTSECAKNYLALCRILESHKHNHKGVTKRKKLKTIRMHSLFS